MTSPSFLGGLTRSTVRRAQESDLDSIALEERRIYEFPWTRGNFRDSMQAGHDLWVFEDEFRMVGYAIVMWLPDEAHLLNLSVIRECQRRGYGRAMMDWLCLDLIRGGAHSVLLEVRPSNAAARALYHSLSFRQIGVRRRYYPAVDGQREDALVLVRKLSDE